MFAFCAADGLGSHFGLGTRVAQLLSFAGSLLSAARLLCAEAVDSARCESLRMLPELIGLGYSRRNS
jgi:hypothetical protein